MATYTNYYSLKKPADDETADIADLNNNADTIDSTMHSISQDADKALDSIAEEYDSSNTYNIRALVWHNGTLYICVRDGATGSWDSSYWYQSTISGGLIGIQSELVGRFDSLQSQINNINSMIYPLIASIAPSYSDANSYVVGDLCMYNVRLYRCISDTTGDWDETAWETVYLVDLL